MYNKHKVCVDLVPGPVCGLFLARPFSKVMIMELLHLTVIRTSAVQQYSVYRISIKTLRKNDTYQNFRISTPLRLHICFSYDF